MLEGSKSIKIIRIEALERKVKEIDLVNPERRILVEGFI